MDAADVTTMGVQRVADAAAITRIRNAATAVRTGSVDTPVERTSNRFGTTVPFVVTPLNGSAIAPLRILAQTSCPTAKIVWALSSHFPYRFQP